MSFFDPTNFDKPTVIAGPCMAESFEIMDEIASFMVGLADALDFRLVSKASFDKANRTSIESFRGPGIEQAAIWFGQIKEKYGLACLSDIHETHQAERVAEFADILQIPAFLCRQTDLLVAAVNTGRAVNIKKGQFLAPVAMANIVGKAQEAWRAAGHAGNPDIGVTERGSSFGYGDLIVDMRSFKDMAQPHVGVVFDVTHSLQKPASSGQAGATSGGARQYGPLLARAAVATGYVDSLFIEVHPDPNNAKSDAGTQFSPAQAKAVLEQVIPAMKLARKSRAGVDELFA